MTEDYYGTKRVTAWPQHKDGKPGYAVKYRDGYISWSPAEEFEAAYRPITAMGFGHALTALKEGHRVARAGWNGKGMFLYLVSGSRFEVNRPPLLGIYPPGAVIDYRPHIDMRDAQGMCVPWLASQTDMLAEDWMIVTEGSDVG